LATFPICVNRQCRMHGDTQEIGETTLAIGSQSLLDHTGLRLTRA
jgi:hypothetical protein